LVRRGEILFAYDSLNLWLDIETHEINEKKEAESKDILISLFLLLVASEFTFIYNTGKQGVP
jgi:hypothetical protein